MNFREAKVCILGYNIIETVLSRYIREVIPNITRTKPSYVVAFSFPLQKLQITFLMNRATPYD